jgi:restriction endonuclease XhoI-like protein
VALEASPPPDEGCPHVTDDDPPTRAIRAFWENRQSAVTEHRLLHSDAAITDLMTEMLVEHGISQNAIQYGKALSLPGGYGPTSRRWDLIAVDDELPIAAIEIKTLIGRSIGNNSVIARKRLLALPRTSTERIGCLRSKR